jgi:hypothetical protein
VRRRVPALPGVADNARALGGQWNRASGSSRQRDHRERASVGRAQRDTTRNSSVAWKAWVGRDRPAVFAERVRRRDPTSSNIAGSFQVSFVAGRPASRSSCSYDPDAAMGRGSSGRSLSKVVAWRISAPSHVSGNRVSRTSHGFDPRAAAIMRTGYALGVPVDRMTRWQWASDGRQDQHICRGRVRR